MRISLRRSIGAIAVAVLLLGSCGVEGAVETGATMTPGLEVVVTAVSELPDEISPAELAAVYKAGGVTVVDVREEWEYAEGHIPGAVLIPLGSLPDRVSEIPTDRPVVLVCRSGNRSAQAYQLLTERGFDNVTNMLGGMNQWQAAGFAVER
jgi:rhodanese-related sulfurtransferase